MSRLPLKKILQSYDEINSEMLGVTDPKELIELSKKQKKISQKADLAKTIENSEQELESLIEMLSELNPEDEMYELAKTEENKLQEKISQAESELLSLLAPEDPRDGENIILEIRAGAGGDESSIFSGDLLKMYSNLASQLGFRLIVVSASPNEIGGFKEVIAEVRGEDVYSWFKYEGGVHRVQRIPATEKQGRIHTSTCSVAIMPLIEQNNDFKLNQSEIEIIISTSSGNGGQSVNTTYSAVKMVHKPTGIEAQSQDEKNQIQNRKKCLEVLTSRVYDKLEQDRLDKEYAERKGQVGKADRSEKIRTYNYPQDRVTDHRYSKSWNQLPSIMTGKILEIIQDIKKIEAEETIHNLETS